MIRGVQEVGPAQVAADPTLVILDIRPRYERFGTLGFIPGSRWFPEERLQAQPFLLTEELSPDRGVVVTCLSGRRSEALVPFVQSLGYPKAYNLRGGLLAWAADYPLCGCEPPPPPGETRSVPELRQAIASCFVAESVEAMLSQGLGAGDFDPKAVVDGLIEQVFARHPRPGRDALVEVVERLGELARYRGHPLDKITENVDRLLAMIESAGA